MSGGVKLATIRLGPSPASIDEDLRWSTLIGSPSIPAKMRAELMQKVAEEVQMQVLDGRGGLADCRPSPRPAYLTERTTWRAWHRTLHKISTWTILPSSED